MRRSHTKSRRGCFQCKQRHNKCNEVHPQCGNCQRLSVQCSFSSPVASPSQQSSAATTVSSSFVSPPAATDGEPKLALDDLELMYHYMTSFVTEMPVTEDRRDILRQYPRLGLTHHFVMHSILGISALHLFSKDRSRVELMGRARSHQATAIRLAHPTISTLTEADSIPVFAFSTFTAISSLADLDIRQYDPAAQSEDPIDGFLACVQLYRGIVAVIDPHYEYLYESWAGEPFRANHDDDLLVDKTEVQIPEIVRARRLVEAAGSPAEVEACLQSVERIFKFIVISQADTVDDRKAPFVHKAVVGLDVKIIAMLQARHPVALIILSYLAVLMSGRPHTWWLTKLPAELMLHIEKRLPTDWIHHLEWSKQTILENTHSRIGRVITPPDT